jgi:hypothetical protein
MLTSYTRPTLSPSKTINHFTTVITTPQLVGSTPDLYSFVTSPANSQLGTRTSSNFQTIHLINTSRTNPQSNHTFIFPPIKHRHNFQPHHTQRHSVRAHTPPRKDHHATNITLPIFTTSPSIKTDGTLSSIPIYTTTTTANTLPIYTTSRSLKDGRNHTLNTLKDRRNLTLFRGSQTHYPSYNDKHSSYSFLKTDGTKSYPSFHIYNRGIQTLHTTPNIPHTHYNASTYFYTSFFRKDWIKPAKKRWSLGLD